MILKVNHLTKSFGDVTPLKDVSCEVEKGDVISIIGPSGTGKSTFVNCLNRLETPDGGEIWFDGVNVSDPKADLQSLRKRMGMVFQSFNLFPHLTIAENIMLAPVEILGVSRQEAYDTAIALLKQVGLADKALQYPEELSGGQQQRAAIVRTLAMKPEVILFDEPTSALDPTMVGEVLSVIRSMAKEGMTMLIVTHEMSFAREVSNRIFYMDEGILYEEGAPKDIFENPKKEKTRWFIQKMHLFEQEISSVDFDFLEFISRLQSYGQRQMMAPKLVSRVHLIFEELCIQLLMPHFKSEGGAFQMKFVLAYNEAEESAEVSVNYDGSRYLPLEDEDDISVTIIRGTAKRIDYRYEEENKVRIWL